MEEYYVYVYIDPRTNKVFYIGKGKNNRLNAHLHKSRLNDESPKSLLILDILSKGLKPTIAKIAKFTNETTALNYEKKMILEYGVDNLTNRTTGGQGVSGRVGAFTGKKHNAVAKEKMRESKLGSNNPMAGDKWHRTPQGIESFKEKMLGKGHPQWNKPRTIETKANISKGCKGKLLTTEQKKTRKLRMIEVWKYRKENNIKIKRASRVKKYSGFLIYENGNKKYLPCLREYCDITAHSFRGLLGTTKSLKVITRGKSKGMRFEHNNIKSK